MNLRICAIAVGVIFGAATAQAAVTYVDATDGAGGNTFATGGSQADTSWVIVSDSSAEDESHWLRRDGATRGASGTIFHVRHQVNATNPDEIPELTTQVTGLADGTYNFYVFFWDDPASPNNTHFIDAGFTSGQLTKYARDNPLSNGDAANNGDVVLASDLQFDSTDPTDAVLFSGMDLLAAKIGTATVSGGSTIAVFVDHSPSTTDGLSSTAQVRGFYDGIGYSLVPEPGCSVLVSLGGMVWLSWRRAFQSRR